MKYINKETDISKIAAQKLHTWRDTYKNERGETFQDICSKPNQKSDTVWDLLKNYNLPEGSELFKYSESELKQSLFDEQGGICCYCVRELFLTNKSKTVVEHFEAKSIHICKNTFTYKNLLLSCEGNNKSTTYYTTNEDSWESVAAKYGLEVKKLQNMNPSKAKQYPLNFHNKTSLTVPKPPAHCDHAKLENPMPIINPTELPDCWDKFVYKEDGFIDEEKLDLLAKDTVKILNLNAQPLVEKRKVIWDEARKAYEDKFENDSEVLRYEEVEDYVGLLKRRVEIFEEDLKTTYPFCVVYWAYFKKQL